MAIILMQQKHVLVPRIKYVYVVFYVVVCLFKFFVSYNYYNYYMLEKILFHPHLLKEKKEESNILK